MKKFDNFCMALENLNDIYNYKEPYDNVILTGLVGLYEICFEQSWKAMKELLEKNGFSESATGSPKQILKTAFKAGLIKEEKMWVDALISRNNVTHAYNKAVAMDIVVAAKESYYSMFNEFKKEAELKWLDL